MIRLRLVFGLLLLVALVLLLLLIFWPRERTCVKVTNDTAEGFAFEVSGPGCSGPARIKDITIRRESVAIWDLLGDQRVRLQVRYGVAPPGFEASRAQPLRPGDKLSIHVRSLSVHGGASVTLR